MEIFITNLYSDLSVLLLPVSGLYCVCQLRLIMTLQTCFISDFLCSLFFQFVSADLASPTDFVSRTDVFIKYCR